MGLANIILSCWGSVVIINIAKKISDGELCNFSTSFKSSGRYLLSYLGAAALILLVLSAIILCSVALSVFAGRIADTGRDPVPLMTQAVAILKKAPAAELIWASPRELLNIFQAEDAGCHIITVTDDILKKLAFFGKDLNELSLDTVKMFYLDAKTAGYKL